MAELPRLLLCAFDVIPAPSGMSRRLSEYLAAMEDRFVVSVLSLKTPDHSHIEKYKGARLMRVPVGDKDLPSRVQAFDRAVRRQLESEEYDLVHFTDPFGGYALCETRHDFGHKLVYEAQAFPSQELKHTTPSVSMDRRFLNRIRRQELFCLMNADAVITGSQVTKAFIHSLGVPEEQVRVLRQPVDMAPYEPDILGVPDGRPMRALYLGSAWAWQGVLTLIDAARFAADETELTVAIVGSFPAEISAELEERITNLGLEDVVQVQPSVSHDDLFKVIAASDVGIAPLEELDRNSHQGGALAKVAEYFAGGRPVIAADVPIAREVVGDEAGIFFEAGNARALAAELIKLAEDKDSRRRLGKRARVLAEQRHDSKRIKKQLLELYGALIGQAIEEEQVAAKRSETGTSPGTPIRRGSGKRRGEKTDPALRVQHMKELEPSTDPEKEIASEPPVVMGIPLRGEKQPEPGTDPAQPIIARPPKTVVPESFVGATPAGALLTGSGKPPLPEPRSELAGKMPAPEPEAMSRPAPPPVPPPLKKPPLLGGRNTRVTDEPEEVSDDDVEEAHADEPEDASALAELADEEPEQVFEHEIAEVSEPGPSEDAHALTSLNPWYAELVHGHCPPEGTKFVRPTPPTNFPGREADLPTSATPAPSLRPKAEK